MSDTERIGWTGRALANPGMSDTERIGWTGKALANPGMSDPSKRVIVYCSDPEAWKDAEKAAEASCYGQGIPRYPDGDPDGDTRSCSDIEEPGQPDYVFEESKHSDSDSDGVTDWFDRDCVSEVIGGDHIASYTVEADGKSYLIRYDHGHLETAPIPEQLKTAKSLKISTTWVNFPFEVISKLQAVERIHIYCYKEESIPVFFKGISDCSSLKYLKLGPGVRCWKLEPISEISLKVLDLSDAIPTMWNMSMICAEILIIRPKHIVFLNAASLCDDITVRTVMIRVSPNAKPICNLTHPGEFAEGMCSTDREFTRFHLAVEAQENIRRDNPGFSIIYFQEHPSIQEEGGRYMVTLDEIIRRRQKISIPF